MYRLQDLYAEHGVNLNLELVTPSCNLKRRVDVPEASRPGLSLTGYLKGYKSKRILVFGRAEIQYLKDLSPSLRLLRLKALLDKPPPAVMIGRYYAPPKELLKLCHSKKIPLFRSKLTTMRLLSKLTMILTEALAPKCSFHGTMVEVYGVGILIKGESSVGKSEAALGLIERGHRLISDDIVKVQFKEGGYIEGFGPQLARHHMEIRGIGIINIANLYGAVCVRERKRIDLIVQLESWDELKFYDRVGLDEDIQEVLGVKIPFHILPVKPGRDVVLLLETMALNHRLKGMGYHSAKEFNSKLLERLSRKQKKSHNL